MITQYIIIAVLFIGAVTFLVRLFYKTFYSKDKTCGGTCNCSAIDLEKIERQIEERIREKASHHIDTK